MSKNVVPIISDTVVSSLSEKTANDVSVVIKEEFATADANVPSLTTTKAKDSSGTLNTYIFFYSSDGSHSIQYLKGSTGSYGTYTVTYKDNDVSTTATGSNSPLASTTWNGEVRLYYLTSDYLINELCLNSSDGTWYEGALTSKKYKASTKSGLYAIGNADSSKDGGDIEVFFSDGDNSNKITRATIDVSSREWLTAVVE